MRQAGMTKPDFIPWGDWLGPKKLSHRHMLIAHLAAVGYRAREIAQATNITEGRLSILLNSEAMKVQIQLIREVEMQGTGVPQALAQLSSQAVRVYQDLIFNPGTREALRFKVAQDILDRKEGKPTQKVEHSGSLFKDLLQAINARATIEAQGQVVQEVKEEDQLPDFTPEELGVPVGNMPAEAESRILAPHDSSSELAKPTIASAEVSPERPKTKDWFDKEFGPGGKQ